MRNAPLHHNMGPAILARLRDFTDLPDNGYVAGQSVASAVSELFGDGCAVIYNDVDVFREQTAEELAYALAGFEVEGPKRRKRAINTCQFTTLELGREYQQITDIAVDRYHVIKTSREGMLNEVFCEFKTTDPLKFLDTFDINAVQACVDLSSGKLFWSPSFELFTKTRQLDVTTLHTPFHSLIRYFRKREELEGTYGNDERIIEMLAAAYHLEVIGNAPLEGQLYEYKNMRWHFGQIYRNKLDAVANKILPHFTVVTEIKDDYPVTRLVPRFDVEKDLLMPMHNKVHCLPRLSRALREKHTKGTQGRLNYLASGMGTPTLTRVFWESKGEDYVKGNVTPAQMAQMDKTTGTHALHHHFWKTETLGEQWEQFSLMKEEGYRRGLWVYGALENAEAQAWTKESLASFLDEAALLLGEKFKKPSMPTLNILGYLVRELVTGMDLVEEGAELHHCVGGYAEKVKKGYSRVLSMRRGDSTAEWVTMELVKTGFGWNVAQNRGLQNRAASDEESAVAQTYANYTNLAVFTRKQLTSFLIRIAPKLSSWAGEKLFVVLATPSPVRQLRYRLALKGSQLATKLGIDQRLYNRKGKCLSAQLHPIKFWALYIRHQIARQLRQAAVACPSPKFGGEGDLKYSLNGNDLACISGLNGNDLDIPF